MVGVDVVQHADGRPLGAAELAALGARMERAEQVAAPLVRLSRAGVLETVHRGHLVLLDADGGRVLAMGEVERPTFARSAMKPLQALSLVESGRIEATGLDDTALALACASHQGEPQHQDAARRMLAAVGLAPAHLWCRRDGRDVLDAERVSGSERPPTLRDPEEDALAAWCSGKHAGFLLQAVAEGWELTGYQDPAHPVQRRVHARICAHLGVEEDELLVAVDGCGAPAHLLRLWRLAEGYRRLVGDPAGERLLAAMADHPTLVGGDHDIDAWLMQWSGGRCVTKYGAEAVQAIVDRETGRAAALKISGAGRRACARLVLGVFDAWDIPLDEADPRLASLRAGHLRNAQGDRVGQLDLAADAHDAFASIAHQH